jgi:Zn/Cd-binding protein ZinT
MAKQSTEKNEKILVFEDQNGINIPLEALQKLCGLANDVADKYESLNLGQFTREIYEDMMENGTLNIRVAYLAQIKSEIKRLNINNPTMKDALFGNADQALLPLKAASEVLKKYSNERIGYFSLLEKYKKASFIDGRFVVTDSDIEKLKDERCRIYIEDDKQKAALESLENVVDAYNKLLESLKPMNNGLAFKFTQSTARLEDYISLVDGKASVYKPALNYFLVTT